MDRRIIISTTLEMIAVFIFIMAVMFVILFENSKQEPEKISYHTSYETELTQKQIITTAEPYVSFANIEHASIVLEQKEFKLTAYTAGYESTGKTPSHPLYGVTATGAYVEQGRTIAADWDILPPGSKVKIEGFDDVFIVEDRGGGVKGRHIDIYMEDLSEALKFGVQYRKVTILSKGDK